MPKNVLEEICDQKRLHIATRKSIVSLEEIRNKIRDIESPRGFISAIKNNIQTAIIAEIKKASPSKGIIRHDFDPTKIAHIYEKNGATCLSVLTDTPYFHGRDEDLFAVKKSSSLPVLRKDFMLDPYQIYESRALGADCVLLIMAALSDSLASELYKTACDLGMDVLVEVHDKKELDRALALKPAMVGINNRSLKTLEVNIQTSLDLAPIIPQNTIKIAESGLSRSQEIEVLKKAGFHGFLIGESLMKEDDIGHTLKKLIK